MNIPPSPPSFETAWGGRRDCNHDVIIANTDTDSNIYPHKCESCSAKFSRVETEEVDGKVVMKRRPPQVTKRRRR